ncbi:MAG: TetR/AcrR family transcriptional regulator [Clostridiales Family XIII bacterium]|jgi:hypothetical protein|nr:TetR/AcrR family transcriptional regulator [Clostridiales Family XIII bacterium]
MLYEKPTKRYLRETALRLFRERSFDEVTVNDICEACDVNKHTFYYYFKSKDELLHCNENLDALSPEEITDILGAESCMEQYWRFNRRLMEFVQKQGINLMKKIFMQRISSGNDRLMPMRDRPEFARLQVGIIERGKASGEFQSAIDAPTLFFIAQNLLRSVSMTWCMRKGAFDLEYTLRYMLESLFEVKQEHRKCQESPFEGYFGA